MRGHVRRRGRRWAAIIDAPRGPDGKRKQRWLSAPTRREAEKLLARALAAVDQGIFVEPSRVTVGEYLERWLDHSAATSVRASVLQRYRQIVVSRLIPGLGGLRLQQLRPEHVQALYTALMRDGRTDGSGGLSARSVTNVHRVLRRALADAVRMQLLPWNPSDVVDPPRPQNREMRALSADELNRLLKAARKAVSDHLPYALVHLAAYTGLRRSELLGLRWGDVDLDLAALQIVRTLHVLQGGRVVMEPPKSQKSQRSVSLSPAAVLTLRAHREKQEARARTIGVLLTAEMPVFSANVTTTLHPATVSRLFSSLVDRAELEGVGLHALRHTHATEMLRAGIHPLVVSQRLGHSTVSITLDTYSHVTAGLQEAAALRFEEGLADRSPPPEVAATVT